MDLTKENSLSREKVFLFRCVAVEEGYLEESFCNQTLNAIAGDSEAEKRSSQRQKNIGDGEFVCASTFKKECLRPMSFSGRFGKPHLCRTNEELKDLKLFFPKLKKLMKKNGTQKYIKAARWLMRSTKSVVVKYLHGLDCLTTKDGLPSIIAHFQIENNGELEVQGSLVQ